MPINEAPKDAAALADWLANYATCIVDDERCGRRLLEIVAVLRALNGRCAEFERRCHEAEARLAEIVGSGS